ncbi:hypothetical protein RZN22_03500 [Bacillaceae bacterium S4-13-58]
MEQFQIIEEFIEELKEHGNVFEWLGIYEIIKWNHIFSVPIYFLLGLL